MIEEIQRHMTAICGFQISQGRQIGHMIKQRSRRVNSMKRLVEEGFCVPPDLACLYDFYDGVDPGAKLNQWQSNLFLQFDFGPAKNVVDQTLMAPKLNPDNPDNVIKLSAMTPGFGAQLDIIPCVSGESRVAATNYPSSSCTYVMFDSVLSMLQSIVMVQDAGLLSYDADGVVDYDIGSLWEVIRPVNPTATYWPRLIDQTLDWDIPGEKFPDFGNSKWG